MEFKTLTAYLQKLEGTSSRIEITKILADVFQKLSPAEIDKAVYLILGILAPGYSGAVFNMAERMVIRAIAGAFDQKPENITSLYKQKGDLGEVVVVVGTLKKASKLSVSEVYQKLFDIAKDAGEESQERKVGKTSELLKVLDPEGAKYITRIILGKLRLGFSDKTILDALSWMETGGKDRKKELEGAYNILPDVGFLAKAVKEKGVTVATKKIVPQLGVPMLPMLMARLKSPKEMIEKMKVVYVEPKFDGLRIQIHFKKAGFVGGTQVKAFTRNLRETSWMFPELAGVGKYIKAKEAILDTEAVGVDEERKAMANFQTTMTRRRKHDIEEMASKVSIKFNVFDVMFLDGDSLVYLPYYKRRQALSKWVISGDLLRVVGFEETANPKKIEELMARNLKDGLEGIAVKKKDSQYIAGRTGFRWVKMKEKESQKAKLADTIDAVVMGYYKGRGKRSDFGLGGFLVGIPKGESVLTLTKIGTGLSDKQFRQLKAGLSNLETKLKPASYTSVNKTLMPDVWVNPAMVVEIAADEITKSPIHSSGYALRFPRLVKFREDKGVSNATTLSEVSQLFKLQKAS